MELLQSATPIKVVQVKENTSVQPDCVYVIPPHKEMSIRHRILHLSDFSVPHSLHLPINFFFRSLADDQQERGIGVILSGMGTDGTAGLKAIKERGGVGFIQEPSSVKFEGMPRSAIEAGLQTLSLRWKLYRQTLFPILSISLLSTGLTKARQIMC